MTLKKLCIASFASVTYQMTNLIDNAIAFVGADDGAIKNFIMTSYTVSIFYDDSEQHFGNKLVRYD